MLKSKTVFTLMALWLLIVLPALSAQIDGTTIKRISVAADGTQGDDESLYPIVSPDGRFVAFSSVASNLVPGDTNGQVDVFVFDRETDSIERVSIADDGTQGNGRSGNPGMSADGRFVVFVSLASNLVPDDTNNHADIFVFDRDTETLERVNVSESGIEANHDSGLVNISADGRYVTFSSDATNLHPDDTNGLADVFVVDRESNVIELISLSNEGVQGNAISYDSSISADGRFVAFTSEASNLVPDDTNNVWDIFVYDRETDTIERVSVASDGTEANSESQTSRISTDGRYVTFMSWAGNLTSAVDTLTYDIFVHDRLNNITEQISLTPTGDQPNSSSVSPFISGDGRYVAFASGATDLMPDDTNGVYNYDIFVFDRILNQMERVSVADNGTQANNYSDSPSISGDGRVIAFHSLADNLVSNDTNGVDDIFIVEMLITADDSYTTPYETQLTIAAPGVLANDPHAISVIAEGDSTSQGGTYSISVDGAFTYTPPMGFSGEDTFIYTATDGTETDTATVTITVEAPPNTPPIANDDSYTVILGETLTVTAPGILSNDTDSEDGPLTAMLDQSTMQGTLMLETTGAFTYTPSELGTDIFTYYANDGTVNSDSLATVTITVDDPAGTPPRLHPLDGATLTSEAHHDWPRFRFAALDGVTWYSVWIGTADYSTQSLYTWYEAAQICESGVCTLPEDVWLANGQYVWWMTYWSPNHTDFSNYWHESAFSVNFGTPATAFTPTSPADGAAVSAPAALTWERDPNALWYQIWVGTADYSTMLYFDWANATQICDATICTLDASTFAFATGDYEWWMQAWGPNGTVDWTGMTSNPVTFTINAP